MLRPAQPPVTAVGEVMTRRALMPRLVNALFATVNAGIDAPVPPGPLCRTLLLESRRSHLYCSAATCAAERTLPSAVILEPLLKVMSVDVGNASSGSHYDEWWTFDPSTDVWTLGGKTPDYLSDSGFELGPAPLMPNGKIIQFGADTKNDIFDTSSATWSSGPAFTISNYEHVVSEMQEASADALERRLGG